MNSSVDAVSCPIQNLAPETLIEIFRWFLCSHADPTFNEPIFLELCDWNLSYPTLRLSWVCSRWRELITALPSFWSSIRVDADCNSSLHEMFLHYVSRSRNAPLTFILDGEGSFYRKGSGLPFIFDTMLDNLHRWHNICLLISDTQTSGWLQRLLADKRPFLNQLTNDQKQTQIRTRSGEVIDLQVLNLSHLRVKRTLPVEILTSCPKLQFLELYELSVSEFLLCDFTNLRTLHADVIWGSVVDVIRRTPLLDELRIGSDDLGISETEHHAADLDCILVSHPLYCSNLTMLSLSMNSLGTRMWEGVIFPHVESLELTGYYYDVDELTLARGAAIITELTNMLSLSFSHVYPDVMPLGLRNIAFKEILAPIMVDFLQSHPSVSQLTFSSVFGEKVHDEIFTLMSAKPFVAPHLHTLSLVGLQCVHYTYTDPNDLDTYSTPPYGENQHQPLPPMACRLTEDLLSMVKVRNTATDNSCCKLQHLILGYRLPKCIDLTLLQDQLASLEVTVVHVDDHRFHLPYL